MMSGYLQLQWCHGFGFMLRAWYCLRPRTHILKLFFYHVNFKEANFAVMIIITSEAFCRSLPPLIWKLKFLRPNHFYLYADVFLTPNILARVTSPGLIFVLNHALLPQHAGIAQTPAWWDHGDEAEITCCRFWSSWHGVLEGPHGARFARWCSSISAFASIEIVNSSCRGVGLSTEYMNLMIILTSISTALNSYFVQDK